MAGGAWEVPPAPGTCWGRTPPPDVRVQGLVAVAGLRSSSPGSAGSQFSRRGSTYWPLRKAPCGGVQAGRQATGFFWLPTPLTSWVLPCPPDTPPPPQQCISSWG